MLRSAVHLALHRVEPYDGKDAAAATARYMEHRPAVDRAEEPMDSLVPVQHHPVPSTGKVKTFNYLKV